MTTPFKLKTSAPNTERLEPFELFAPHCLDSYKLGHIDMYPPGTEYIYDTFTPRSDKHLNLPAKYNDHKYVVWGALGAFKDIVALWDRTFFQKPKEEVLAKYRARTPAFTGKETTAQHLADLHDLGYLPLRVKMIEEGSRVDIRVPFMTVVNTNPKFFWLPNGMETHISNEIWKPMTVATIANAYRRILDDFAKKTDSPLDFVPWQGHDFADRGMPGMMDAAKSGGGHTLNFWGSDSVSAFDWLDFMYDAEKTFKGGSVPATEHSVMTIKGIEGELEVIRRIITEVVPTGVVSFVADGFDFWKVLTEYAPLLKDDILARGFNEIGLSKVVFRPDSGNPADILCGTVREIMDVPEGIDVADVAYKDRWDAQHEASWTAAHGEMGEDRAYRYYRQGGKVYEAKYFIEWNRYDKQYYYVDGASMEYCKEVALTSEQKGAVEVLWEIFGGSETLLGYKLLSPRVGLIYGDSITPHVLLDILQRLEKKGFASGNVVFGIGSYTYQYMTRDTLGMAIKAVWASIDSEAFEIFKDPKTDSGMKKSAKGLVKVLKAQEKDGEKYILVDQCDWEEEDTGELKLVFENGNWLVQPDLAAARTRLGV